MDILVIGFGNVGSVVVRDLVETFSGGDVVVAGKPFEGAKALADTIGGKVSAMYVDVMDHNGLVDLLRKGFNVVVNAAPYRYNIYVMKAALEAGVHYVDLGGLYHVTLKQLELNDEFKKVGVAAILGCGCAPGITNVLAKYGADMLDTVDSVYMYSGTVTFRKVTGIRVVYAISTLLDEATLNAWIYKDGRYEEAPPFSSKETLSFPELISDVDSFIVIHSEHATIPHTINKGIRNVIFRIVMSSEAVAKIKALNEIGLMSQEKMNVGSISISPREFLERYFSTIPPLRVGRGDEVHVVRVDIIGLRRDEKVKHTFDVINDPKPEWSANSSGYITGISASIVAQMIARGEVQVEGVVPPETCVRAKPFINELVRRGVRVYERISISREVK